MNNMKVQEISLIELLKKQCMLSELGGKEATFVDSEKIVKIEKEKGTFK